MEQMEEILDKITHAWNFYFWEHRFCQNEINFTEEIKTNYYGDILSYFTDTSKTLSKIRYAVTFEESIFQAIGALQIIYTQQDLVDELLHIFKLPPSTKADKNPNRKIRNELVGHPIRRMPKSNELLSSAFFGRESKNGTLHYILYSQEDGFAGQEHFHQLEEVISRHDVYLRKYIGLIWNQITVILRRFQKEVASLNLIVTTEIEFRN